ncbi:MAG: helix-turn-helix domain-containing protein [Bacteroidetes Order II. Incertae sedis bacterium]|nr:helix-turn-helix domain-containing protein [Bacteroidetes Order II. bacterium]
MKPNSQNWIEQETIISEIKTAYLNAELFFAPVPTDSTLAEITDFIRKSIFCQELRVSVIEETFHLCQNRKLKLLLRNALHGMSLQGFLTHHRIALAKKLLLETHFSVAVIAFSCGYDTLEGFEARFKKRNAYAPSTFRTLFAANPLPKKATSFPMQPFL